tara:strand:- start:7102 stop:8340 length:1239 start_codon:yes stop_codon:yes gene_type:complete
MSQTKAQLVDAVDGSIVAADLAADCVTTAKVANSAITDAKISGLTSSKLTGALPAISGAALTGISSAGKAKNLVVNGAMQVAQRLDSQTTSSTSSGYQALDRFPVYINGADENPTITHADIASGTTPYTLGFRKSLKITNGNQTSGAGSNDYIWIQNKIEAQDIANSGWNYLSASSYITLSFWVKSSVAQTFKGYIETMDGTAYQYPFETGSLTADTWTKITKSIPGNSNLQFDNNTAEGFKISIIPMMGTDKTASSVTEDAWSTYSSSARIKDVTTTWYTTNDATFELTGVQLEVGDSATDFAHEDFGSVRLKCQRYFNRPCGGMAHSSQGNADDHGNIAGAAYNHTAGWGNIIYFYPIEMRANPTITFDNMRNSSDSNTNLTEQVGNMVLNIFMINSSPYITDMRLDAEL